MNGINPRLIIRNACVAVQWIVILDQILMGKADSSKCVFPLTSLQIGYFLPFIISSCNVHVPQTCLNFIWERTRNFRFLFFLVKRNILLFLGKKVIKFDCLSDILGMPINHWFVIPNLKCEFRTWYYAFAILIEYFLSR